MGNMLLTILLTILSWIIYGLIFIGTVFLCFGVMMFVFIVWIVTSPVHWRNKIRKG